MRKLQLFLMAALLLPWSAVHIHAQDLRHKEWWLQHHSAIDPSKNDKARRSLDIFRRLKPLAETKPERDPELLIIDAEGKTAVLAIDDGTIILPISAIDLCYRNRPPTEGDDLLGFVLGHELTHLASDEFRHLEAFYARERYTTDSGTRKSLDEQDPRPDLGKNEWMADDRGLALMTMAGFNPKTVVSAGADFFESWVRSTPNRFAASSSSYPSPASRAEAVKARLLETADKITFFKVGVRFYEMGAYEDAISLLEAFSRLFPGPVVRNDLGLCHFQLAAQTLANCESSLALRFKLPTLIDPDSLAKGVRRGDSASCYQAPDFLKHKVSAREYFEQVIHGRPDYYPARLNLTSLLVLSGDGAGALSAVNGVPEKQARDPEIEALSAIAVHLYDQQDRFLDTADAGLKKIRVLAQKHPRSVMIAYNRARLELESGDPKQAKPFWEAYLRLEPDGSYADFARAQGGIEVKPDQPNGPRPRTVIPPSKPTPAEGGTAHWLASIDPDPVDVVSSRLRGRLHRGQKLRVLTIGSEIVLIESRLDSPLSKRQILEKYGPPERVVATTRGEFLGYSQFGFDIVDGWARETVFLSDRSQAKSLPDQ